LKRPEIIHQKLSSLEDIVRRVNRWRLAGKTISFTNGVYDILHPGHIYSLSQAAREADVLVVGVNSDNSVKRIKGEGRPVNPEDHRLLIIASLIMTDAVLLFEEDTPIELIKAIRPDVIVKGGDYTIEKVVGAGEVLSYGGRVIINPTLEGHSTTQIIARIASGK
jgi:D-glycero-beta-D-manno-heptose 1-phosphate adenylyltransferase